MSHHAGLFPVHWQLKANLITVRARPDGSKRLRLPVHHEFVFMSAAAIALVDRSIFVLHSFCTADNLTLDYHLQSAVLWAVSIRLDPWPIKISADLL